MNQRWIESICATPNAEKSTNNNCQQNNNRKKNTKNLNNINWCNDVLPAPFRQNHKSHENYSFYWYWMANRVSITVCFCNPFNNYFQTELNPLTKIIHTKYYFLFPSSSSASSSSSVSRLCSSVASVSVNDRRMYVYIPPFGISVLWNDFLNNKQTHRIQKNRRKNTTTTTTTTNEEKKKRSTPCVCTHFRLSRSTQCEEKIMMKSEPHTEHKLVSYTVNLITPVELQQHTSSTQVKIVYASQRDDIQIGWPVSGPSFYSYIFCKLKEATGSHAQFVGICIGSSTQSQTLKSASHTQEISSPCHLCACTQSLSRSLSVSLSRAVFSQFTPLIPHIVRWLLAFNKIHYVHDGWLCGCVVSDTFKKNLVNRLYWKWAEL